MGREGWIGGLSTSRQQEIPLSICCWLDKLSCMPATGLLLFGKRGRGYKEQHAEKKEEVSRFRGHGEAV
jgi:hypothetical protein